MRASGRHRRRFDEPLAEVLHGMGLKVQGSDMNDGPSVEHLRSLGIPVAIGHAADNLGECDFVIRTAPSTTIIPRSPAR